VQEALRLAQHDGAMRHLPRAFALVRLVMLRFEQGQIGEAKDLLSRSLDILDKSNAAANGRFRRAEQLGNGVRARAAVATGKTNSRTGARDRSACPWRR